MQFKGQDNMYLRFLFSIITCFLAGRLAPCFGDSSRSPVRFDPLDTNPNRRTSSKSFLKTQAYCFQWKKFYLENGRCSEILVEISDVCTKPPYFTFYVPCHLNINTNSYIGFWVMRVWDYLYCDSGSTCYFMNRDGTCLRKSYRRKQGNEGSVIVNDHILTKAQCDRVKVRVENEAGPIDEDVVKWTWNEPEKEHQEIEMDQDDEDIKSDSNSDDKNKVGPSEGKSKSHTTWFGRFKTYVGNQYANACNAVCSKYTMEHQLTGDKEENKE